MNTILVPTDFSDGAFNALGYAMRLADLFDYSIKIVHAYRLPAGESTVMVDLTEIMAKSAKEELELLKTKVEAINHSNILITYEALYGGVIEVIHDLSRSEGVELVVMGTQGASGITDKWLGTVAASAAKNVEDPLLIIPADQDYRNLDKILFATDLEVIENEKHLRFLAELSNKYNSELNFLHVRKEGEDTDDEKVAKYRDQLNSIFGEERTQISYLFDDDVDDGIEDGIETHNPDLLVIVRHKYGFFEGLFKSSISRKLISDSELPILVLQDKM